jgi:hypothetical protein
MKLLVSNERLKKMIELEPDDAEIGAGSLAVLMEEYPEEFWKWFSEEFKKSNIDTTRV